MAEVDEKDEMAEVEEQEETIGGEQQEESQISDDGQEAEMAAAEDEQDVGVEGEEVTEEGDGEVYQSVVTLAKSKPYLCTYENCDKAFQWKSYLERHIQSHTGIKPDPSQKKKRGPRRRKNEDGTEDDTPKVYVCNGKKKLVEK